MDEATRHYVDQRIRDQKEYFDAILEERDKALKLLAANITRTVGIFLTVTIAVISLVFTFKWH